MNDSLLDWGFWIAFSVGLAILSGVLHAYLEQKYHHTPERYKWWGYLRDPWLVNILRFVYAISIPAIVLFWQGGLTYRGLGFKPFPWVISLIQPDEQWSVWLRDMEAAFFVTLVTWLVLTVGSRYTDKHKNIEKPGIVESLISAVRESSINQAHWAFYRALMVGIWGIALGSWIVWIPLALELSLNPETWTRLQHPQGTHSLIIRTGILIASTILYLQTQNLWFMWCADFVLQMLFAKDLISTTEVSQSLQSGAYQSHMDNTIST